MNKSINSFEPPYASGVRPSCHGTPLIVYSVGLWLAITIGVTFLRHSMVPIYVEFELDIPIITQMLVHPLAPIFFGATTISIFFITFGLPSLQNRKLAVLVAIVLGIMTGFTCAFGFFGPLIVTINALH